MGKFLSDMISLGIEGVFAYSSAKKKAEEAKGILDRLTSGDEEVPVAEFLRMYDLRIYDFDSKQDDIKFMKNWDFEGVYVLHNCSKSIYHIGRSSRVLRKIDRTFRGYEKQEVYVDWERGNDFKVRIVRFEGSGFSDIKDLEKELTKQYGTYQISNREDETKKPKKSFWKRLWG